MMQTNTQTNLPLERSSERIAKFTDPVSALTVVQLKAKKDAFIKWQQDYRKENPNKAISESELKKHFYKLSDSEQTLLALYELVLKEEEFIDHIQVFITFIENLLANLPKESDILPEIDLLPERLKKKAASLENLLKSLLVSLNKIIAQSIFDFVKGNSYEQYIQELHKFFTSNHGLFGSLITPPLYEFAEHYQSFLEIVNDKNSKKIKKIYPVIADELPIGKTGRTMKNFGTEVIPFIQGSIILSTQRLAKYKDHFAHISKFEKKAELLKKISAMIVTVEAEVKKVNEKKRENETASPSDRSEKRATVYRLGKNVLLPIGDGDLNEDAKDICMILLANILEVTNCYRNTKFKFSDEEYAGAETEDAQAQGESALKKKGFSFKFKEKDHINRKQTHLIEAQQIAYFAALTSENLSHQIGQKQIGDALQPLIMQIKESKGGETSRLVGEFQDILDLKFAETKSTRFPEGAIKKIKNATAAKNYIQKHHISEVNRVLDRVEHIFKGYELMVTQRNRIKTNNVKLMAVQNIRQALNNLQSAPNKPKTLNELTEALIIIFRDKIRFAGKVPSVLLEDDFGQMLIDVSNFLDTIVMCDPLANETTKNTYEILTSVNPSISINPVNLYEIQHPLRPIFKISKSPRTSLTLNNENINDIEEKNSTTLCALIQGVSDYYWNRFLALETVGQVNLQQGWKKEIKELDEAITRIYLVDQGLDNDQAKLTEMITIIRNTSNSISSKGSRMKWLLGELANCYEQQSRFPFEKLADHGLPSNLIKNITTEEAHKYINRHVLQLINQPLLEYQEKHRFFRSYNVSQQNGFKLSQDLSGQYNNDVINIDDLKQIVSQGDNSVGDKQYNKTISSIHSYMQNIGLRG